MIEEFSWLKVSWIGLRNVLLLDMKQSQWKRFTGRVIDEPTICDLRMKLFDTPEELWDAFQMYVEWNDQNPLTEVDYVGATAQEVIRKKQRPLSIAGFKKYLTLVMGHPPLNVHGYFKRIGLQWKDLAEVLQEFVAEDQISRALVGQFNANLTARLNKLSERSEVIEFKEQPLFAPISAEKSHIESVEIPRLDSEDE